MEVFGYKALNSDLTNNYGFKFEEGKNYHIDGNITFGVDGNGFHLSKRFEDTFRYIDDKNMVIAKVCGYGNVTESFDNYNEYFDMYSVSDIRIDHIMTREEVISEMLNKSELAVMRFIFYWI